MINDQAIHVWRSLLVERATDRARSGEYDEAERLLAQAKAADDEDPVMLDLLARIRAQQGRYGEAEVFWKEAARLDPGSPAYRAGLARVRAIQSRPYSPAAWSPLVRGVVTLTMFCLVGVILWSLRSTGAESQPVAAVVQPAPTIPRQATPTLDVPQPPKLDLTVPGVALSTEGDTVLVTFEQGLFDSSIRLLPEAEKTLERVGRQLQSQRPGLRIEVVGHTNDLPVQSGSPFADNVDLGLRRAVVVTNLLRAATGSQGISFSISSLGETSPPYRHDAPDGRARNRTVILRIGNT